MALIRTSAPPVFISAVGAIVVAVSVRAMGVTESTERLFTYVMLAFLGAMIYVGGLLAQLIVMGGASRNLVMHLLWDEPVTARLIYRSVRSRFWGLLWAAIVIGLWLFFSLLLAMVAALIVMFIALILIGVLAAATAGSGTEARWLTLIIIIAFYLGALV